MRGRGMCSWLLVSCPGSWDIRPSPRKASRELRIYTCDPVYLIRLGGRQYSRAFTDEINWIFACDPVSLLHQEGRQHSQAFTGERIYIYACDPVSLLYQGGRQHSQAFTGKRID
jgi:hypothetical protein